MKTTFLGLALTLVIAGLLPATAHAATANDPEVQASEATAAAVNADTAAPAEASWADILATDSSCQTEIASPAAPSDQGFEPSPCFGPNPPLSCHCGSCCSYCKCWQGYYLALCDFEHR